MKKYIIRDEFGNTANVLHFHGQNINQLTRTFNIVYTDHIVGDNYDRTKLAIVSTWTDDAKCCLLQQCKRFNIPLINCVPDSYDRTQQWYMPNKIRFFIKTLESIDQEIVMFLDGYDVLLTNLDNIIQRFEEQKYRILFGPSCNNYPDIKVDVVYKRYTKGVYRFFNAGCCIGYREDLLKFYKEALEYIDIENPWKSEQLVMRKAFAKYSYDKTQSFIGIDHSCIIFRSMGVTDSSFNIETGEIYFSINRPVRKRIIVTGSDGFIGRKLVQRLRQDDPNCIIYEIDRKRGLEAKNIDFLFNMNDIDVVFHLAAQTSVFNNDHQQIVEDNISTFVKIVELCRQNGTKLVYASSSTANNVTSTYGLSKYFDEYFTSLYDFDCTGVRLHNVYSEEPREGTLAWHILHDDIVKLYNSGENKRHFTYVDDAVEGLIYAFYSNEKLLNCFNPTEMTTAEFSKTICEKIGKKIELLSNKRQRDREVQSTSSSLTNIPLNYIQLTDVVDKFISQ